MNSKSKFLKNLSKKNFTYLGVDHKNKFLITGGNGQIGRGLGKLLGQRYGLSNIILTDNREIEQKWTGNFDLLDVVDKEKFKKIVVDNKISHIIHLASMLSASSEKNLELAKTINIQGVHNAIDIAKETNSLIFIPSTIATYCVANNETALDDTFQSPNTYYGVSKIYMERLGNYYHKKFGVNFRCLRYPSIISPYQYVSSNTASFATELFYSGLKDEPYKMYIDPKVKMAFMYLDDCLRGTIEFLETGNSSLSRRVYNFHGFSTSPEELVKELKKIMKHLDVKYEIDPLRNEIAKAWPGLLDDSIARKDWGWKPKITKVKDLTSQMIKEISTIKL